MKLFHDYKSAAGSRGDRSVVTIGNFDGVHRGHRAVLDLAKARAEAEGLVLSVLTFEPHPASVLRKDVPPMRLASPGRKIELLGKCGVQTVLAQRFDRSFAALDPEIFAKEVLAEALGARLVVVGLNFRFGVARAGDVSLLEKLGGQLGFEVIALDLVTADDGGVSSSRIRELISNGEVEAAAKLLGRPHQICGVVVKGKGQGAGLGFPTANLDQMEVLSPGAGIYASRATVGGREHSAAVYVGDRPTLGHGHSLEAHLLDFEGDLYGEQMCIAFERRIRGEIKFDGIEELRAQMARDVAETRRILRGRR